MSDDDLLAHYALVRQVEKEAREFALLMKSFERQARSRATEGARDLEDEEGKVAP